MLRFILLVAIATACIAGTSKSSKSKRQVPGIINSSAADPLYAWFSAIAGQDQRICPQEMVDGLRSTPTPIRYKTSRQMIALLDRDYNGYLGFTELKELLEALSVWKRQFYELDQDQSNSLDVDEFKNGLIHWGYNLGESFYRMVALEYVDRALDFSDFVYSAVRIRQLTSHLRMRDPERNGIISLPYDEYIQLYCL